MIDPLILYHQFWECHITNTKWKNSVWTISDVVWNVVIIPSKNKFNNHFYETQVSDSRGNCNTNINTPAREMIGHMQIFISFHSSNPTTSSATTSPSSLPCLHRSYRHSPPAFLPHPTLLYPSSLWEIFSHACQRSQ